jgi:hypothetical protein
MTPFQALADQDEVLVGTCRSIKMGVRGLKLLGFGIDLATSGHFIVVARSQTLKVGYVDRSRLQ